MKTLRTVVFLTCLGVSLCYSQNNYTLSPYATFGPNGDGSVKPGDLPYVEAQDVPTGSTGFHQRGLAYDPVSGNLVYVDTHSGSGGSATIISNIFILNGSNGNIVTNLNLTGMSGGAYVAAPAAVADDGVIYVANQVTVSTNQAFKIYRWDSVNSIDPPVVAFSGTLAPSQRYGTSIDIRGSGTSTEILMGSMIGTTATNVVLFTTADGTNFVANVIGCTNLLISGTTTNNLGQNFNDGISFGPTNTFWAKSVGRPLLYMSYNLASKTAQVLNTFFTSNMVGSLNLGPIAINPSLNLLAAIELTSGTVAGGPDRLVLYDISNTAKPPALLSIREYAVNFNNATAPLGYLDFGGGRLYANIVNNGLLVSTIDSVTTPSPTILTNLPGTNRVAVGQTARWQVTALPNITGYQWKVNGGDISGATNYILDVPNVSLSDSGKVYSVVVSNAGGTATSSDSLLSVVNPADLFHLTPLWAFGPGGTNFISNSGNANVPNERTIAYNSLSNQLIVVRRNGNVVSNFVIDAHSGQFLYTLRTNGISPGGAGINIPLCAIAVAADGAIYACSVSDTTANPPNFKIYRWANSDPNTYPSNVFSGNPAPGSTTGTFRWGDILDVRGSGTGTQIIVDNQDAATFRLAGVIVPSGADLNLPWTAKGFVLQNNGGGVTIGRSLQFEPSGDFFWQKRYLAGGSPLVRSSFALGDTDPALAAVISSSSGLPLSTNGAIGISFALKLGAAINFSGVAGVSPDELNLYDLAVVETPVLLNRYNFPANQNGNANRIAQVIMASNSVLATNYVFALNANNGIMAFTLSTGPVPPPKILAQPSNLRMMQGVGGSISVVLDSIAFNQWQKDSGGGIFTNILSGTNTTYAIANAQLSDSGIYRMYATNSAGAVTSAVAVVSVNLPANNYSLAQVWATAPGTLPYATSSGGANTPLERSIAYNALSNQLIVVQCPVNSTAFAIYVVDGSTGANLYTLNTSTIVHQGPSEVAGANPIDMVAVAVSDDGSIYVSSESPNASGGINLPDPAKQMRVYRWANSDSNTVPIEIFAGDPASQTNQNLRWGDAMSARGSGINTELILDDTTLGAYVGILKPVDGTLTSFTNAPLNTSLGSGPIGHSIQFGSGSNLWSKRKGLALKYANYNINSQIVNVLTNYNFTPTLGGVAVDESRDLAIGVDHIGNANNPDAVALYEISDASTPMLIARYNFPANQNGNANFISQTVIAGSKVYSLDGNNGIMALTLVPNLRIDASNPNLVLSWENLAGFTLQATPSLAPTPTWTNVGTGTLVSGRYYQTNTISGGGLFYRLRATLGQ